MKSMQNFHSNIAKIDALAIKIYEKEVIRSAYYNHINNIPISPNALAILKKYNIVFRDGGIDVSNMKREQRKQLYKRREEVNIKSNPTGTYEKSFLNKHNARQNTLTLLIARAEQMFMETQKFIADCEELTNSCFKKSELSYSTTKNMIETIRKSSKTSIQTLNDFLQPFLEHFEGLQPTSQQEILKKSNAIIEKIHQTKDTITSLCIKLSAMRVNQAMPTEHDYIQYINHTIKQFDNYIR